MKRVFLLSLVILSVLVSSSSFAAVQNFTRLSVNVPSGWTASETETGSLVQLVNDEESEVISIQVGYKAGTLKETAEALYEVFEGQGEIRESNNLYTFSALNGAMMVFDNQRSSGILEGFYCMVHIMASQVPDELTSVLNSITINESWANSNNTDNTTGGTVQNFTTISVSVPDGWTASESDTGDSVQLMKDDETAAVGIQVMPKDGDTLQECAEFAYDALNGTGEIVESNGVYTFSSSNGGNVLVFDDQVNSGIIEGFFCVTYWLGSPTRDEFNSIANSITINKSWADTIDTTHEPNTPDTPASSDVSVSPDVPPTPNTPSSPDTPATPNTPADTDTDTGTNTPTDTDTGTGTDTNNNNTASSGGGGGGCTSGTFPVILLLIHCAYMTLRKD